MTDNQNSESQKITISLRISIPSSGRPGMPVEVQPAAIEYSAPAARGQDRREGRYAVTRPSANESWPVKVIGSGNTGVICAWGDSAGITPKPDKVLGYCYTGATDHDPPAGAVPAPVDASGYWLLDAVPPALAGSSNILKVWYVHNVLGIQRREEVPFAGYSSDKTYCEMIGSRGDGAKAAAPAHVYLPLLLIAEARGFSKGLADFNGRWPLQLVPSAADTGRIAWRHKRKSKKSPQISLIANQKKRSAVLLFKHHATEIRYRKRGGQFNPINVCDFAEVSCRSVKPAESVPAIVQVRPGTAP